MRFNTPSLNTEIYTKRADPDPATAAVGENFAREERVGGQRVNAYEARQNAAAFTDGHDDHLRNSIRVSASETFDSINGDAAITPDSTATLVRIEAITRPIRDRYAPGPYLHDACDRLNADIAAAHQGDAHARAEVARFIKKYWLKPGRRDHRPVFAAILDDVRDVADDDAWCHALPPRLGWSRDADADTDVLIQVRYTVDEVRRRVNHALAFAAPTVLDAELDPAFFPSPVPAPGTAPNAGRIVDVSPGAPTLPRELVHPPIPFTVDHIRAVGIVTGGGASATLSGCRRAHLDAVRRATGRPNF